MMTGPGDDTKKAGPPQKDSEGPEDAVTCRIVMRYDDPIIAKGVRESLAPDDEGHVRTRLEGGSLVAEASAPTLRSLVHTLEDFLSCAAAAEQVLGQVRK